MWASRTSLFGMQGEHLSEAVHVNKFGVRPLLFASGLAAVCLTIKRRVCRTASDRSCFRMGDESVPSIAKDRGHTTDDARVGRAQQCAFSRENVLFGYTSVDVISGCLALLL